MALEGGGILGPIGAVLGPVGNLLRALGVLGGGLEQRAPRTAYERTLSSVFLERAPQPRTRPPPPAPRALGGFPAPRAVLSAAQSGTPGQIPPSTAEQILDAAIRGVQRGYELRDLLELFLSLFRKPASVGGQFVPYLTLPAPVVSSGSGGLDFGDLGQGIAAIINAFRGGRAQSMPGGAPFTMASSLPTWWPGGPSVLAAAASTGVVGGSSTTAGCPQSSPFSAGGAAARPQTWFLPNPVTGKLTWFKPAGQPLLWSGDLSAAKRVRRVARMAKRRAGGR